MSDITSNVDLSEFEELYVRMFDSEDDKNTAMKAVTEIRDENSTERAKVMVVRMILDKLLFD